MSDQEQVVDDSHSLSAPCNCALCSRHLKLVPRMLKAPQRRQSAIERPARVAAISSTTATRCEATLLFSDISGYSQLTEQQDIELVAAMLDRFRQSATRIIHAHGGFVNQFVGDEVLAIFGFPTRGNDAPQRAIDAALDLHELAKSTVLCRRNLVGDNHLLLHSGIDAGVVLLRRRDLRSGLFELTGGAVNRAARLRAHAGPDEIVVSERVYARVAPFFVGENLTEQRFKGIDEISKPSRILGRRDSALAPVPRSSGDVTRSEVRQLLELIGRDNKGRVCIVLGPAGSGKTRLLDSLDAELSNKGLRIVRLQGRKDACRPFASVRPLLDLCDASNEALDSLKIHELLERSEMRLAILVDDSQWLDRSSQSILLSLARRVFQTEHLFVLAARNTSQTSNILQRIQSLLLSEQSTVLRLGALKAEDATTLVGNYLGIDPVSAPTLAEQLSSLTDGTPLSLLGMLELVLKHQMLRGDASSWQLASRQEQPLPPSMTAHALFERHIVLLAPQTRFVLRVAAITRSHIDHRLIARVTELSIDRVQAALDDALVARLLDLDQHGNQRFSHDLVWEALLHGISADVQRRLHQRVAEAMRMHPETTDVYVFALAHHYAAGVLGESPNDAYSALYRAAQHASRGCDDFLARDLLTSAEAAACEARLDPGPGFYAQLAETCVRVGKLDEALRHFDSALTRVEPGLERAHLLGRVAWVHHYQADGSRPLELIDAALRETGLVVPQASSRILLAALHSLRGTEATTLSSQRELEIKCGMYREYVRICMEREKPLRCYAAAFTLACYTPLLRPCRVKAQSEALIAICVSALGARQRAQRHMQRAFAIALSIDDAAATAYCHQVAHVEAAWRGDFGASEAHARASIDDGGQYVELGELCLICLSMYAVEVARGRNRHALEWTKRAIDRVLRIGYAPAVFAVVRGAAYATLVSMGQVEAAERLRLQLGGVEHPEVGPAGVVFSRLSFIPRIQELVARKACGDRLEDLMQEFAGLVRSSRRTHRILTVFYFFAADSRVQQCLRANAAERVPMLQKLKQAMDDLDACPKAPYVEAHMHALHAAYAYFHGRPQVAERHIAHAKHMAQTLGMAWVSFSATRLNAHLLRDAGKHAQALEEARLAEKIALQHEQSAQLRAIREEFDLAQFAT